MMTTPICDFVKEYNSSNPTRFHMPAHKGKGFLGIEGLDITEIKGADSLFSASTIIAQSEKNASHLFGCETFYSTEGSSLCIRAMVYLARLWGGDLRIIALRNSHKTFLSSVALLDLEVDWLYSDQSYLSSDFSLDTLEEMLSKGKGRKTAVYLTSPDYLGNRVDIKRASELCKKYNALLLVDNAHGAYLKFLDNSCHPMDLGADMCCDSAHKTLPVLTGGAYLHISKKLMDEIGETPKNALSLFASTSPSYLILQSLDMANLYISEGYKEKLSGFIKKVDEAKSRLKNLGFDLSGNEPLKICIKTKKYGYFGFEMADYLEKANIFIEFADRDNLVLMLSVENGLESLEYLVETLGKLERKEEIKENPPKITKARKVLTPRQAMITRKERVAVDNSLGRILAEFNLSCPPAVPILVCGEEIDETTLKCFAYYGINEVDVVI